MFKNIKYTIKHIYMLNKLAIQYNVWHFRFLFHDLDKIFLYLIFNKKTVQKIHRWYSSHHVRQTIDGNLINPKDPLQAVLDWESARYTKPDKPLNAYETWRKYYPSITNVEKYIKIFNP